MKTKERLHGISVFYMGNVDARENVSVKGDEELTRSPGVGKRREMA